MIQRCSEADFDVVSEIVNDAAQRYNGVIPDDCWHAPYMSADELTREIADGVVFWGFEEGQGGLVGVMGIQDRGDVTLIRHAYVRTDAQKKGIGTALLKHLESTTEKPLLIGTWAAASWAIRFYEKNGYQLTTDEEKYRLLKKYWSIPDRQVETSVVLADRNWFVLND